MAQIFKLKTTKGQIVYKVTINIQSSESMDNKTSINPHGIFIEKLKIVHQTGYKIVLSDPFVTLLDRQREKQKRESYYHFIDDVSVRIVSNEAYFPNGIFAYTFTLSDPHESIKKIKRNIVDKINKDYGFLRFADIESIIEVMEINQNYIPEDQSTLSV